MAPPEHRAKMFGLFALSGRVTAFVGPAVLAWTTHAAQSRRAGMATILVFLFVGLMLLLKVPEVGQLETEERCCRKSSIGAANLAASGASPMH